METLPAANGFGFYLGETDCQHHTIGTWNIRRFVVRGRINSRRFLDVSLTAAVKGHRDSARRNAGRRRVRGCLGRAEGGTLRRVASTPGRPDVRIY